MPRFYRGPWARDQRLKFSADIRMSRRSRRWRTLRARAIGSSRWPTSGTMRAERIASLARFVISLESNANHTHSVQFFERTLDDSANRRLVDSRIISRYRCDPPAHDQHRLGLEVHPAASVGDWPTSFRSCDRGADRASRACRRRSSGYSRGLRAQHRRGARREGRRPRPTTCSNGWPPIPGTEFPDDMQETLDPSLFGGRAPEQ